MQAAAHLAEHIAGWAKAASKPLFVGLCGSQGCGKTTIAGDATERLTASGLRTAILSLDDVYLTLAERRRLARDVHPLFVTRGPPGTHDMALAWEVLDALRRGATVRAPRFDKLADDRRPEAEWSLIEGPLDVIILEGWCVGAAPQATGQLAEPVNALERDEDPQAVWRTAVNHALAGPYARLFGALDRLAMLKAPNFEVVSRWRLEQEETSAAGAEAARRGRAMGQTQMARFVQHYERLTRWMLAEVPNRADLVIDLDERRGVVGVRTPAG